MKIIVAALTGIVFLSTVSAQDAGFVAHMEAALTVKKETNEKTTFEFNDHDKLNPEAPKETEQWGQFVGEWDCVSKDLDTKDKDNPKWYTNKATWSWQYVLGGHAVLNQWWQEDKSPNPVTREFFVTGIFIFNPQSKLWEIVILNSQRHKISPKFQAEYKNGKILMHDGTGKWLVTFFDIEKNSFEWKYEILTEGGKWKPISEISAKRRYNSK